MRGRRPNRRIRRALPRQQQPDSIRLAYFGALRQLMLEAKTLVDRQLVPLLAELVAESSRARGDDEKKVYRPPAARSVDVNEVMAQITAEFGSRISTGRLSEISLRFAAATSAFQREQLAKQLRAAVGVEVPIRDGKLGAQVSQFTQRNVALIKSIPQRYLSQVEAKVLDGVEQGRRWETIADDLQERYEVSESTAKLIARDQVGKLYGSLNETRQTELGITQFQWNTMNDGRVRETHQQLQGRIYDWDDLPDPETGDPDGEDGIIPGEEVNCRCYASPVVSSVLEEL